MRSSYWAAGLVVGLLFAGCARQATVESTGDVAISASPADTRSLPSGTMLDVRLDQEIGTKTLRKAGIGAAAGAALCGILSGGDLDKILIGGALGAAAGTVISLGMGDVEGVLPAGTTMKLQTTRIVGPR